MVSNVSILGSTGSIGEQTLTVLSEHPELFRVYALSANRRIDLLLDQIKTYRPQYVACVDLQAAAQLRLQLRDQNINCEVLEGKDALVTLASDGAVDIIVAAIVGGAGLPATFAAAQCGKKILLANKEALVMGGHLFMDAVREHKATLLPVDSEHNAIFQCMPDDFIPGQALPKTVTGAVLTASGGPFLRYPLSDFHNITPAQAVAHPNWVMGQKISVDSATMMNKGLELIEASWLFSMKPDDIEVVIHPQSIVHSFLRYIDGSVMAQCGVPDMRSPIANCLSWPDRIRAGVARLDILEMGRLDFEPVDMQRFPCLKLAYQALSAGLLPQIILNTVNEVAVASFLAKEIKFTKIVELSDHFLNSFSAPNPLSVEEVIDIDTILREKVTACIHSRISARGS